MLSTETPTESELLALAINIHSSHQEIHSQPDDQGGRAPEFNIMVEDVVDSIVRIHSALPDESPEYAELDRRVEAIFNFARFDHDLEKLQNEILQRLGFA